LTALRVRDLNRFIDFLRGLGLSVVEGSHMVLLDGSEIGVWHALRGDEVVLSMAVHYIDAHYEALMKLPPDAGDEELLAALIEAERRGLWRAPVEPVLLLVYSEEVAGRVMSYSDEPPPRAIEALRHFETHGSSRGLLAQLVSRIAYGSRGVVERGLERV